MMHVFPACIAGVGFIISMVMIAKAIITVVQFNKTEVNKTRKPKQPDK